MVNYSRPPALGGMIALASRRENINKIVILEFAIGGFLVIFRSSLGVIKFLGLVFISSF